MIVFEKGAEYEFGTWPHDADVEYWAQDDMAEDAPLLMSWWGYWDSFGTWTEDGGWSWLDYPDVYLGDYYPGYCRWLPTLRGSPDVAHLGPGDFPMEFEAVLTDYPAGRPPPRFHWETSDGNLRILSPRAQRTLVAADSLPSWCESRLSVTADFGNDTLLSELVFHYGIHEEPQVTLSLRTPEIVFLNDDDRTSRWYRVEVSLSCPVETNATVSIEHTGGTGARFASDPAGAHRFALTNITLSVSAGGTSAPYLFYCACTNLGTGTFSVKCADSDDDSRAVSKAYKVIEPLRKLVTTEEAPNGGYYNPSRDWGDEQGRGFYEKTDSGKSILYQLLMYGVDGENSLDIPSHDVLSLIQGAFAPTLTFHSHVGVDFIIPDNSEVFTQ